jgi:hypothetical protein
MVAGEHAKVETINGRLNSLGGVAAGSNVLLAANGAVLGTNILNGVVRAGGDITILGTKGVVQHGLTSTTNNGKTIYVEACRGSVEMTGGTYFEATNGNIQVKADDDIRLAQVNAGCGNVRLEAVKGSITNVNGTVNNVTADGLQLVATNGNAGHAGGVDYALNTTVNNLAAEVGQSVYVTNSQGMTVGTVGAVAVNRVHLDSTVTNVGGSALTGITAGANVKLVAAGSLTVTNAISARTSGHILLEADANVTVNAVVISGSGNVALVAGRDIDQSALVGTAGSGTILAQAGGSIRMTAAGRSQTQNRDILYSAGSGIAVGDLDAGTGQVGLKTAAGGITDANGAAVNVRASGLVLSGAGDIGTLDDPLDVMIGKVAGEMSGNIFLKQTGDIAVGTTGPVTVNRPTMVSTTVPVTLAQEVGLVSTGDGSISLRTEGAITVEEEVTSRGGNICLRASGANGNIDLANSRANLTTTGDGRIALWADWMVHQRAGLVESDAGNIYVAGTEIIQDPGAIVRTLGRGTVVMKAGSGLTLNGSLSATAGSLALGAANLALEGTLAIGGTAALDATGSIGGRGRLQANNISLHAGDNIGTAALPFTVDTRKALATKTDRGAVYVQVIGSASAGVVTVPTLGDVPPCMVGMPLPAIGQQENITSASYLDLRVGANLSGNLVQAREGSVAVGGNVANLTAMQISAGNLDSLKAGGGISIAALTVPNGNATVQAGGPITINTIDVGDSFRITGGQGFAFRTLSADAIDVDVNGRIGIGVATARNGGTARFNAGTGDIVVNGSHCFSGDLTLLADGDIGSASAPIEFTCDHLREVRGNNVWLDMANDGIVDVGSITAASDLHLMAATARLTDGNGDTDNIVAGGDADITVRRLGTFGDPLEMNIGGTLTLASLDQPDPQQPGRVWIHGKINDLGSPDKVKFPAEPPGLIVFNNQLVGGGEGVMREVFRTEAFYVETPELKSRQGVFGSPYFLHADMGISEPVALGLIDYLVWTVPRINLPADMPRPIGK